MQQAPPFPPNQQKVMQAPTAIPVQTTAPPMDPMQQMMIMQMMSNQQAQNAAMMAAAAVSALNELAALANDVVDFSLLNLRRRYMTFASQKGPGPIINNANSTAAGGGGPTVVLMNQKHGTYCGWKSWLIGLFLFPCICCCKSAILPLFVILAQTDLNRFFSTPRSDRYLLNHEDRILVIDFTNKINYLSGQ